MFRALVRPPTQSYIYAINDWFLKEHSVTDSGIDISVAQAQHSAFVQTLQSLHVSVTTIPPDERFPDGCFAQDPILVHDGHVLQLNASVMSRRGEAEALVVQLSHDGYSIERMQEGYCDGGDVVIAYDIKRVWVGLSARTDRKGYEQVKTFYEQHGFTMTPVDITRCLHLSTGASYLNNGRLLISPLLDKKFFEPYSCLVIPEQEKYAANVLVLGQSVLLPDGYPVTQRILTDQGFNVITLSMTEFQKADGQMTCLSNLFVDSAYH